MFCVAIRILINGAEFAFFSFFINFLLELLSFASVAKKLLKYLIAHSPAFFIVHKTQSIFGKIFNFFADNEFSNNYVTSFLDAAHGNSINVAL